MQIAPTPEHRRMRRGTGILPVACGTPQASVALDRHKQERSVLLNDGEDRLRDCLYRWSSIGFLTLTLLSNTATTSVDLFEYPPSGNFPCEPLSKSHSI